MAEFEVMRYPDRDARHEKWMAAYEVVWRNQQGSEYISVPFSYEQFLEHRLSESERRIKELEKAQLAPATSAPRGGTAAADDATDANTFQRAVRAMGRDDELAVALYQAHTFEGVANDMTRERDALQAENARLRAALKPFADSYHVYSIQYASEYGDMLNYATDVFDGESFEANCKAAYDALQAAQDAANE